MSSREQEVNPVARCAIDQQFPINEPSTANDDCVPSCWICLEVGPDQSGKELVRDCSCRGDSGFAYLGCLVEYVKQTSMDLHVNQLVISDRSTDSEVRKFTVHWQKYSICHQMYQRELALDLVNSLLLFIDENESENNLRNQLRYTNALIIKLDVLCRTTSFSSNSDLALEGKQTAYKLLAMDQQLKIQAVEAFAHEHIGYFEGLTKDNYKVGIKHYRKARKIFESRGDTQSVRNAEVNMSRIKAKHEGTEPEYWKRTC